jgi:hypothetical protein
LIATLQSASGELGDAASSQVDGPSRAPRWSTSRAPRLRTEFDWRWLTTPPRLAVATTAGTFAIELAAEAAPVHIHHLLRRLTDPTDRPTTVLERDGGCLRLGRADRGRPPADQLLRRQPTAHDPFAIGLVGLVPSGLPDLDGLDLFVTLRPRPDWLVERTVVGRVVGGMGAVHALHAGAKILDITVLPHPM